MALHAGDYLSAEGGRALNGAEAKEEYRGNVVRPGKKNKTRISITLKNHSTSVPIAHWASFTNEEFLKKHFFSEECKLLSGPKVVIQNIKIFV